MSRFIAMLALAVALAQVCGCGGSSEKSADGKLQIVATTGPVGDMVRGVVGEHGTVEVLMGPGVDPHGYQERPSDIRKLESADIVFYNGLHLEGQLAEVLERRGERRPVYAVTEQLKESHDPRLHYPEQVDGFIDPHIWHNASLWADCTEVVAERLAEVSPEHAQEFAAAADEYKQKLLDMHAWCREQIDTIPADRRVLVTAHDAFAYFSEAYGLESVGMKGISTQDEVSLGRMDEVVKLVVERKLPAVFVESSVAPRIIEALIEPCQAAGHEVKIGGELYSDSLGSPESGADYYEGMMRANVTAIVTGLRGE